MAAFPACPAPALLAGFCRDDEHTGRHEAAVVFRNVRTGGSWDVLLVTDENFFPVSSTRFAQSVQHEDWRPIDWVWSDRGGRFAPPGWEVAKDGVSWDRVVVEEPESAEEAVKVEPLPVKSRLFKPRAQESLAAWSARCRRKYPALETEAGGILLGETWNEHKSPKP
jgi:hypothetical protein